MGLFEMSVECFLERRRNLSRRKGQGVYIHMRDSMTIKIGPGNGKLNMATIN
jgi:hypothetical protein